VSADARRLESLDAFRGMAVASMILVNNPGSWVYVYEPLVHSNWDGCTFADLIFPCFIFIVGLAMPFAFARRTFANDRSLYPYIARRAALLVALGLILNLSAAASLATFRIPGVLQRIGIVYFVAAIVMLHARAGARFAIAAALLVAHWALLTLVPFGGLPAGAPTAPHNLGAWIDAWAFGRHLLTPTGDPEGLLGTLPAVATALFGTLAGDWIRRPDRRPAVRILGLALAGAAALACGFAWAAWLPLNKALWTGSFVMVTTGCATLAFAACYVVIDVAGARAWARPFVWLGGNPLAIYFLSELAGQLAERPWLPAGTAGTLKAWLYWTLLEPRLEPLAGEATASFVFACAVVALWLAAAAALHRRRLRIRV
jgi:predicted acyltransferase